MHLKKEVAQRGKWLTVVILEQLSCVDFDQIIVVVCTYSETIRGNGNLLKKAILHEVRYMAKTLGHFFNRAPYPTLIQVLQCSYLRLSQSNVQTLEEMIRERGGDPGIHIHTDVTDIDIWKGLREERIDLIKASEEAAAEEAARKERTRKAKRGSIVKIW